MRRGSGTSLVYRSASGDELLMVALYGRHYGSRLAAVAEQVPAGASVLELCCGPGTLYERYLRERRPATSGWTSTSGSSLGWCAAASMPDAPT